MHRWMLACLVLVLVVACGATETPTAQFVGTDPQRPDPSLVGRITVHVDTGATIVGRHLHVEVDAVDVNGAPIDAGDAELTSTNPSVVQLVDVVAFPVTMAPMTPLYGLSATFDLTSVGSAAIRARLGILSDSVVISVIPPSSE